MGTTNRVYDASDVPSDSRIREASAWLRKAAGGQGLTIDKLLDSSVIRACAVPSEWSHLFTAVTLQDLVRDQIEELPNSLDRDAALVALNIMPEVTGASPTARFENLGRCHQSKSVSSRPAIVHASTFARHWRRSCYDLAARMLTEIARRNEAGWDEYEKVFQMRMGVDLQPFVVERLEVSYFIDQHHVCTETITQRWLRADLTYAEHASFIDHYKVRARYLDPQTGQKLPSTEILPYLNCRAGPTEVRQDGWLTTPMYFSEPVPHNGTVFFATRVKHRTTMPVDPAAFIQVTSLGIMELIMRVQFEPSVTPGSCWIYGGPSAAEGEHEPEEAKSARLRTPNALGYVEYHTENCPPGWYYTIGWKWPEGSL